MSVVDPALEHHGGWSLAFRGLYRVLGWMDPLMRAWWRRFGLGNVVLYRAARRHVMAVGRYYRLERDEAAA